MSINPICDVCKQELKEFGALLFSPPEAGIVQKFHLCPSCYEKIVADNEISHAQ